MLGSYILYMTPISDENLATELLRSYAEKPREITLSLSKTFEPLQDQQSEEVGSLFAEVVVIPMEWWISQMQSASLTR